MSAAVGDTSQDVKRLWKRCRKDFDWDGLEAIRASTSDQTANRVKYLDAEKWLISMCHEAVNLTLHDRPPLRILDIGSGPGYFPYVCTLLGHDAWALDRPSMPLFVELRALMHVPFVEHAVRAREALPALRDRFDLVTAHRVQFNAKKGTGQRELFDLDDWAFFLDDLRDRVLVPGGGLILKMINQDDYTGLKFGDAPLMRFFESRGARIPAGPGRYVIFEQLV